MSFAESFLQPIDVYCERLDFSFWSEPLNAWSNLAFFAAAFILLRSAVLKSGSSGVHWQSRSYVLPFLLALVGVFSFLFHTTARQGTAFLDSLFILIFGCFFLFYFVKDVLLLSKKNSVLVAVGFGLISFSFPTFLSRAILNGSLTYLPYFLTVALIAFWTFKNKVPGKGFFLLGLITFIFSLFFRIIDPDVCESFPWGTHFLWHLLNGFLLFVLTAGIEKSQRNVS